MLKVNREVGTRRCFAVVSESRHSPLVLVGAPAQGCSSPLIHVRIKCSLRVDSSTLCRGESPTTAHNLSWVIHKLSGWSPSSPITTKPSRWWRSPRVTSTNSHLTTTSLGRRVDAHFATLDLTNEGSLWDSQISITSLESCSSWHSQRCFLGCWNEQKYPHTRMEEVFISMTEKRTVMCLCGVTGRSGNVDRTL